MRSAAGLRAELEVRGPGQELHRALSAAPCSIRSRHCAKSLPDCTSEYGRVTIPGFYDDVREWNEDERAYMARAVPSDDKILQDAGVEHGWGEQDYAL